MVCALFGARVSQSQRHFSIFIFHLHLGGRGSAFFSCASQTDATPLDVPTDRPAARGAASGAGENFGLFGPEHGTPTDCPSFGLKREKPPGTSGDAARAALPSHVTNWTASSSSSSSSSSSNYQISSTKHMAHRLDTVFSTRVMCGKVLTAHEAYGTHTMDARLCRLGSVHMRAKGTL